MFNGAGFSPFLPASSLPFPHDLSARLAATRPGELEVSGSSTYPQWLQVSILVRRGELIAWRFLFFFLFFFFFFFCEK